MSQDQKIVAVGAASGVAAMGATMFALYSHLPWPIGLNSVLDRVSYALQANAFAALPLIAGVVAVGNSRFLSPAIDPLRHQESRATQIDGNVLENTLQQQMLFFISTLALSINITASQMRLIAAATTVFLAARIAFWIGYRIHPIYRAPGFAATFYLNAFLLGFAFWRMR